jgi:hypothetical protein
VNWVYRNKKTIAFMVGVLGLLSEMVAGFAGHIVDQGLVVVFGGLLASPLFLRSDEQREAAVDEEDRVERSHTREPRP